MRVMRQTGEKITAKRAMTQHDRTVWWSGVAVAVMDADQIARNMDSARSIRAVVSNDAAKVDAEAVMKGIGPVSHICLCV